MVTRSRLPRKSGGKKTTRLKRAMKFHQITEEEFNRRTVLLSQFKVVNYYSDATSLALGGKNEWGLRGKESDASPENRDVDTTKQMTMYTAVNPELEKDEYGRWVAIASIDGKRGMVVHQEKTKKEIADRIAFDNVYSMYAPSLMWRNYRFLQGWKW